jgi:outer membrane protein assembly factor BamB
VWRQPIAHDRGLSGAPRIAGDTLLVPAGDLLALDAATGALKWTLPMYGRGAGTPVLAGDRLLVQGATALTDGRLSCVELATGHVVWTLAAGNDDTGVYLPTLIASARGLLVAGVSERGNALSTTGNGEPFLADVATGTVLWDNPDVSVETSPVFANGQLFFHGQNFRGSGDVGDNVGLLRLDASTGAFEAVDTYFRYSAALTPLVLADNGVFGIGANVN